MNKFLYLFLLVLFILFRPNIALSAQRIATPTINPPGGTYSSPQSVTIRTTSTGSVIYCSTSGVPTRSLANRCGTGSCTISVSSTSTIRCRAEGLNRRDSLLATATFTINQGSSGTPQSFYSAAVNTCSTLPLRGTGTTHYYCDCQTDRQDGCIAGSDINAGTSPSLPRQSLSNAVTTFNSMPAGDTIAFCKGGSWRATGRLNLFNSNCSQAADMKAAANTTTCDIRDYTPAWGGTNQPRITQTVSDYLFTFISGAMRGVRILNLNLIGGGTGPNGTNVGTNAIVSQGAFTDSLICGNTIDGWVVNFNLLQDVQPAASRITLWGNNVTRGSQDCFFGGMQDGGSIDANIFDNCGSVSAGTHAIYLRATAGTNMSVTNNQFLRTGPVACGGSMFVVHDQFDGLNVENNLFDTGPGGICYAIGIDSGDYPTAGWYRNLTIRRNRILNLGNEGIHIGNAPNAIVENNVIVGRAGAGATCINMPAWHTRVSPADDPTTASVIRNNTCYFPSGAGPGLIGIYVGSIQEGTGHIISNNIVNFADGSGTCFSTSMSAGSYAFIGNNACNGTWSTTYDATTHITTNPQFTNAASGDFTLLPTSPLRSAGNGTYKSTVDFNNNLRPGIPSIGAYDVGLIASRPFTPNSPWNTPTPPGTVWYDTPSLHLVNGVNGSPQHYWVTTDYGIYFASASDPMWTWNLDAVNAVDWNRVMPAMVNGQYRSPANTDQRPNDDMIITTVDLTNGNYIEVWLGTANQGARTVVNPGGVYATGNIITGLGIGDDPTNKSAGVRASNFPWIAGLITQSDIDSGAIRHALAMALPAGQGNCMIASGPMSGPYRAPATAGNSQLGCGPIAMGTKIGIPAGIPRAAGLSTLGVLIWDALQTYGAYVGDGNYGWPAFYADGISMGIPEGTAIDFTPFLPVAGHWLPGGCDFDRIQPYLRIADYQP